ncbi:DNA replication/repair protein RecF [Alkalihalobacillus sp. AL-G]|uniref:DNA replication/repair protein RecF n=1 Tax=Alkalihalobacillus sp. AL-G TaxID=2926399 RepID=UPI00272D4F98|nr:DNA replication/repair protein RecF [Alkalihalobacillus sp. AL-G]WLD93398.1 DNA replication/repair protein RecF [Alkalihalobacillus sp. AL-G]
MYLQELQLKNYRNYESEALQFEDNVNVFVGENAQGKTNVMEAIYVLGFATSHRTSRDKELIHWDSEYGKIEGRVQKRNGPLSLQIVINQKGKKAKYNHIEQRRLTDYIGALNIVMFAPEDLNLVKGSPQVRRRFIDMEIGQISPVYLHHLNQYKKILQQRNHLLRDMQRKRSNEQQIMLDILTEQLVEQAVKIVQKRYQFLDLLQEWAAPIHRGITKDNEKLDIQYKSTVHVSDSLDMTKMIEEYYEKFGKIRERELERGTTMAGPHRDDLILHVNEKDVQTYGSQGQQRTTALSLKLAEIELIKAEVGEYPLLLLDDVLSELDDSRQSHLLNTIEGKVQTFVTTTSVKGIEHDTLKNASLFNIQEGTARIVK